MFKKMSHFLPDILQKDEGRKHAFYLIIGIGLLFILFSNPFLKVPFDVWEHLLLTQSYHDEGHFFTFSPDTPIPNVKFRYPWYIIYSTLFKVTGIDNIFTWAKIIHTLQFMFSFLAIFYFSYTVFKILLPGTGKMHLRYFSLFSVFAWFIGNGTLSVGYQQAWVVWYSVTPQGISHPLFWYIAALTVKIFYEKLSIKKLSFFSGQIFCISFIILKLHPQEFVFFCIHLAILSLLNLKKIVRFIKRHYFLFFLFLSSFLVVVSFMLRLKRKGAGFFSIFSKSIKDILKEVSLSGNFIINARLHRFPANFSEIVMVSLILALFFLIFYFIFRKRKQGKIIDFNFSLYLYLVTGSVLFFLIPMNRYLIGVWAFLSHGKSHVPRFFFGSAFFIFIPFLIYIMLNYVKRRTASAAYKSIGNAKNYRNKENIGLNRIVLFNLSFICLLILSSKFLFYNVLYQNTCSVFNMLDRSKVGLQYTGSDLQRLKKIILSHEEKAGNKSEKPDIFYIRADLAPIVKGIFRKYVFQRRRNSIPAASFFDEGLDKKYNFIEVDLPPDFPKDEHIFKYFNFEKVGVSSLVNLPLPGETNDIKFNVDKINTGQRFISIEGWGYIKGQSSDNAKIYVVLKSHAGSYIFDTHTQKRPDVTRSFKTLNFDDSGFRAIIKREDLPEGKYNVGLYLKKESTHGLTYRKGIHVIQ